MTRKEEDLILKDLCARLPYGVKFQGEDSNVYTLDAANYFALQVEDVVFKPYLRPMSSMTEEECKELGELSATIENVGETLPNVPYYIKVARPEQIDWLNEHHFDYRIVPSTGKTMIDSDLALEAPEGMYESK